MNEYTIVFRSAGAGMVSGAISNQIIKADMYRFMDGFIHFYIEASSESIGSFAADDVLSVVKTA